MPFADDNDIALGIAVKTFLDDHVDPSQATDERRKKRSAYAKDFLPHSVNFPEDLDTAFHFFDALCSGVQILGNKTSGAAVWKSAKDYLDARRPPSYDAAKDAAVVVNGTPASS